jgi:hypothetical protein
MTSTMRWRWAAILFLVIFWSLVAFALAGCASDQCPPPAQVPVVVPQKVIVTAPCVNRSDIAPEPPHVANQLTGQSGHDLLVVDQSALALRTWGESLSGQLVACSSGQ